MLQQQLLLSSRLWLSNSQHAHACLSNSCCSCSYARCRPTPQTLKPEPLPTAHLVRERFQLGPVQRLPLHMLQQICGRWRIQQSLIVILIIIIIAPPQVPLQLQLGALQAPQQQLLVGAVGVGPLV